MSLNFFINYSGGLQYIDEREPIFSINLSRRLDSNE
jgi:hypothetical protein